MERKRLIQERLNRKLTQKDVSKIIGISTVYVRKLEKGNKNPGRETMLKFQALYNCDAKHLFPDLFFVSVDTKCIKKLNSA